MRRPSALPTVTRAAPSGVQSIYAEAAIRRAAAYSQLAPGAATSSRSLEPGVYRELRCVGARVVSVKISVSLFPFLRQAPSQPIVISRWTVYAYGDTYFLQQSDTLSLRAEIPHIIIVKLAHCRDISHNIDILRAPAPSLVLGWSAPGHTALRIYFCDP